MRLPPRSSPAHDSNVRTQTFNGSHHAAIPLHLIALLLQKERWKRVEPWIWPEAVSGKLTLAFHVEEFTLTFRIRALEKTWSLRLKVVESFDTYLRTTENWCYKLLKNLSGIELFVVMLYRENEFNFPMNDYRF